MLAPGDSLSPHRRAGLYAVTMSFCLAVCSFVHLLPMRTCRAMAWLPQHRNSAGGRKRPPRCWARQARWWRGLTASAAITYYIWYSKDCAK